MPLIAKANSGGQDFDPIPAGVQHAVCYAIYDVGTQAAFNPAYKPKRTVIFIFELPHCRMTFEKDGKQYDLPRAISDKNTLSLSSQGNLRPKLESWRGRAFTEAELEGFDVFNVAGANCYLNLIHKTKGEKTYTNIAGIMPLPANAEKLKPENEIRKWSIDDQPQGTPILPPDHAPGWIKELILKSEEYVASHRGAPEQDDNPTGQAFPTDDIEEDDVPF